MISPSVYSACRKRGMPVVQTLHNFRLLCPGAQLFRDGKICEDCGSTASGGAYGTGATANLEAGDGFDGADAGVAPAAGHMGRDRWTVTLP